MSVAYTALMLLAIAGATEFGVIGAAFASAVPWTIMLGGVAYDESALMLYTATAVAWALRAVAKPESSGVIRAMIVAGASAGFACGVKITAVPMLLVALPLAMAIT